MPDAFAEGEVEIPLEGDAGLAAAGWTSIAVPPHPASTNKPATIIVVQTRGVVSLPLLAGFAS